MDTIDYEILIIKETPLVITPQLAPYEVFVTFLTIIAINIFESLAFSCCQIIVLVLTGNFNAFLKIVGALYFLLAVLDMIINTGTEHQIRYIEN